MSLRIILLLVVCAFGPAASAAEPQPVSVFRNLQAGKKQTVLVYGTSLTAGGAWANALKKWFDDGYPGLVTFINSGGPGQNSDWGKTNLKAKVLDRKPNLVFIEFSYNDAHEKFKMPVTRGAENLDAMVRAIREQDADAAIVLQIMNAPWDAVGDKPAASSRPQLEAFNDNYRRYAREHSLPLIDHYPAYKQLEKAEPEKFHKWLPDGSHPSAEASLAITWPAIKDLLEKSRAAAAKSK
jgi:lysophospholipase L1-like esterase